MTLVQADSTYAAIERKVRHLTASASESALPSVAIQQYVNTVYNNDFPYAIKIDQMRSVYTFYTEPYIDRYPLDVNYNQGIREPVYFEGIQGYFFKDRQQFYNMWPRFPTKFNPITGDGTTQQFTFTIQSTPFLSKEVVLGGVDTTGGAISVIDDGLGNLFYSLPNPVVSVPPYTTNVAGMKNLNSADQSNSTNPGQQVLTNIGTVNYVTGAFYVDLSIVNVTPISGQQMTLWVSQYQTGRPYTLLFWNNEFIVRPIPQLIHKVEVETYLTPVQFMETTDHPILNQWWQYIAILAGIKVLEDRQDMEGVANLDMLLKRQEGLILERQGVEEINQRNSTLYSSTIQGMGWNNGSQGWY